ncbi:MAG: hypothetical protein V1725_00445 [archaeon]
MGGSSYDRDVGRSSSSGSFCRGSTSSNTAKSAMSSSTATKDTDPKFKRVESKKKSPIVFALDVTGSNIEFARIVYDKAPMLHGQIEKQGYLKDFDICFAAVGDAYSDHYPLQVCDFKHGIALDEQLKKLYLEGNGGGQQTESYEVAAHYFSERCSMPNAEMPFFFFIGDEAPYPSLDAAIAKKTLGLNLKQDIPSKEVFDSLFEKFKNNVYFLQNPYCGRRSEDGYTRSIRTAWQTFFNPYVQNILPVHEEKAVIDIILGAIAITSKSRDLEAYLKDMQDREQTAKRIATVGKSLTDLSKALVPVSHAKPTVAKSKKNSGGKRF